MKKSFVKQCKKHFNKLKKTSKNISVLDYIALGVFFAIVLIAALFFLRKATYIRVTLKISNHENLYMPWLEQETPEWYLENISVGLEEKDVFGRINSRIEKISYYPRLSGVETVYVELSLRTALNRSTGQYSYKGSPITVSSFQEILTSRLRIPGVVTSIAVDGKNYDREEKDILVKGILKTQDNEYIAHSAETSFDGIRKYVSEKIEEGMIYRDFEGNFVAEIIEVRKTPAKRTFIFNGHLVEVNDSEREKVEVTAKLRVKEKNSVLYYMGEEALSVGKDFEVFFENFMLRITITDFLD